MYLLNLYLLHYNTASHQNLIFIYINVLLNRAPLSFSHLLLPKSRDKPPNMAVKENILGILRLQITHCSNCPYTYT